MNAWFIAHLLTPLSTSGESLYVTLGIEKASTEDEIKRAYKKVTLLSMQCYIGMCVNV